MRDDPNIGCEGDKLRPRFVVSEPLRRRVKWQSPVRQKAPRTEPERKAPPKVEVVLEVTAVTVKVAMTTVAAASRAAARRSLDPTAAVLLTRSQDDNEACV